MEKLVLQMGKIHLTIKIHIHLTKRRWRGYDSYMTPTPMSRYTCYSILFRTRFGMDGYGDTTFRINCHRT